jgi:hypothetical protein
MKRLLLAALLLGCRQADQRNDAVTSASARPSSVGVPICDEALAAMAACAAKVGGAPGEAMKLVAMQTEGEWKRLAAEPSARPALEARCKSIHDAQRDNPACR